MITASIQWQENHLWVRVVGHAGYASPGQDIVCAAASILSQTLARRLGRFKGVRVCQRPGLLQIEGRIPKAALNRARAETAVIWEGFWLLQQGYPQCVQLLTEGP